MEVREKVAEALNRDFKSHEKTDLIGNEEYISTICFEVENDIARLIMFADIIEDYKEQINDLIDKEFKAIADGLFEKSAEISRCKEYMIYKLIAVRIYREAREQENMTHEDLVSEGLDNGYDDTEVKNEMLGTDITMTLHKANLNNECVLKEFLSKYLLKENFDKKDCQEALLSIGSEYLGIGYHTAYDIEDRLETVRKNLDILEKIVSVVEQL